VVRDLADYRQVARAVHLATERMGAVDVLVNDAAMVGGQQDRILGPPERELRVTLHQEVVALLESEVGKGSDLGASLESGRAVAAVKPGVRSLVRRLAGYGVFETEDACRDKTSRAQIEIATGQ
jgi:hypothetical protein